MSTATDGRRIEHAIRHDLESYGYTCVRSAGSKGAIDLVAIGHKHLLFVQVKRTNLLLAPLERKVLLALCDRIGLDIAAPIVAGKPFRKPIAYRLLTGPGPRDWITWTPEALHPPDTPPHRHSSDADADTCEVCFP